MQDLVFDTPFWLLGLLLAGGIALWWSGNNRQDKALKRVGLVVFLLGFALALTSYFVDTAVESAMKKTKQLVYAFEKRDWLTFDSIIDQRTTLAIYQNKLQLTQGAQATADLIGIKAVHVIGSTVQQTASTIQIELKILSEQDRTNGQSVVTNWRFDWQDFGTGWKLASITPLQSPQVNVDQILSNLARGR